VARWYVRKKTNTYWVLMRKTEITKHKQVPFRCAVISCVLVYVRLTQHICKYIYPIQGYMFRLSISDHQAFLEHKTFMF
jgi:hypothetical protein